MDVNDLSLLQRCYSEAWILAIVFIARLLSKSFMLYVSLDIYRL